MLQTTQLSRLDIESLPNYQQKTKKEWSSSCPQCHGQDRFLFWPDKGNFYCRKCGLQGFILEVDKSLLTQEQRDAWKRADDERKRKETEERLSAIERLQKIANKVELYHSQVSQAGDYWYSQGLNDDTICQYQLGYCPICPTDPNSPSFTIPYFCKAKLINLRHRLKYPNGHGKYRPEFAGLGNQLFNLDTLFTTEEISFGLLNPNELIIVEGEIKAMVLEQVGYKTIGIPGANSWRGDWGKWLKDYNQVFICLDPGADRQAQKIAESLASYNLQSSICQFPVKPDDFFTIYGGNVSEFSMFLAQGKKA